MDICRAIVGQHRAFYSHQQWYNLIKTQATGPGAVSEADKTWCKSAASMAESRNMSIELLMMEAGASWEKTATTGSDYVEQLTSIVNSLDQTTHAYGLARTDRHRQVQAGAIVWRAAWIGGLLGAVAALAGCTTTSPGQPAPTGPTTAGSPSGPETSTSTSEPRPARPREIRLDGKDPCALIPESDWPRFHIDKPGKRGEQPAFKSPDCFYSNNFLALSVTLVVTEGIGKWTDGSRIGIHSEVEPVEGFPAISITRKEDKEMCGVAVDIASGQYLLATVNPIPSKVSELPERCEYAHQVAESAMKTLVTA